MDHTRFDFKNLKATGVVDPEGDKAFDPEDFPVASFAGAPAGLQVVSL
jgi:tRNA 2-thiocytidine biosynthesis protein TtcA